MSLGGNPATSNDNDRHNNHSPQSKYRKGGFCYLIKEASNIKDFPYEKERSSELDLLGEIEEKIRLYNNNRNYHYLLKSLKPVRRAWF